MTNQCSQTGRFNKNKPWIQVCFLQILNTINFNIQNADLSGILHIQNSFFALNLLKLILI